MRAVICALNSKYVHSSLAPWCLAVAVEENCEEGIQAVVVEGTINECPGEIVERILELAPQVIGFCCYIWNIKQTLGLIRLIKGQLPQVIITLGGPEVSYNAREVLRGNPLVDFVISGEGEKPFALLLNALRREAPIAGLPGLCCRSGDEFVISDPHIELNETPSPYTKRYLEALHGRIAYLETSRGCPFSCTFCLSGRCGNARFFDLERAKSEILLLANSGAQTVKLVDRTFNANGKRAYELFKFIINNYGNAIPKGVCFHFEIAGDLLDDETIDLLASAPAGAMQLEIGLQSFHPETLKAVSRKTDVNRLKSNISKLVQNANMHIHIDLIAGLPFEGWESFREGFNGAYSLKPHMLQLGFLKILHGSPMREEPDDFPCEYSQEPPYEVIQTPYLSAAEMVQLHAIEDALERVYNSGRFPRTLEYLLQQCDLTPFDLFHQFGAFAKERGTHSIPLDEYTEMLYAYFCGQNNVDKIKLRDALVCDRLATDSSGVLPRFLRVEDPKLKMVKEQLNHSTSLSRPEGVKRSVALLYSEPCAVYVDYENRNPVTNEYPLKKVFLIEE